MKIKVASILLALSIVAYGMKKRPRDEGSDSGYDTQQESTPPQSPVKYNTITIKKILNTSAGGCQITFATKPGSDTIVRKLLSRNQSFEQPILWHKNSSLVPTLCTIKGVYLFSFINDENKIRISYFNGQTDKELLLVKEYMANPYIEVIIDETGIPRLT